jgi:hypothetical protein
MEMVQTAFALYQSPRKEAIEKIIFDRCPPNPEDTLQSSPSSDSLQSSSGAVITPPSAASAAGSPPGSPQVVRDHVNPLGVKFEDDDDTKTAPKGMHSHFILFCHANDRLLGVSYKPFGLPVLVKLFRFICSIINPNYQPNTDSMRFLGLGLVNTILELKASTIDQTPKLLTLIQEDLCKYLIQVRTCVFFLVMPLSNQLALIIVIKATDYISHLELTLHVLLIHSLELTNRERFDINNGNAGGIQLMDKLAKEAEVPDGTVF